MVVIRSRTTKARAGAAEVEHNRLGVQIVMDALSAPFRIIAGHGNPGRRRDQDLGDANAQLAGECARLRLQAKRKKSKALLVAAARSPTPPGPYASLGGAEFFR